jgi:hypothetical protein
VTTFATEATEELLSIDLASELPVGPATLSCSFEGVLNDKMVGFYRSKYTQVSFSAPFHFFTYPRNGLAFLSFRVA